MKLGDIRSCDGCGAPLITPPGRWFQLVRTTPAIVTETGVAALAAAARNSVPLERLEADRHGKPLVAVLGDDDPDELVELTLCVTCYQDRPIAECVRARQQRIDGAAGRPAASRPM